MSGEALLALAERCEKAEGPDRELDTEIAVAVSGDAGAWVVGAQVGSIFSHKAGWWRDSTDHSHLAATYTGSLDAPFSLIDGDEYWRVGNDGDGADPSTFKATVTSHDDQADLDFHDAHAATAPLALCAAALRARAQQEPSA